jgi:hypothetical protein
MDDHVTSPRLRETRIDTLEMEENLARVLEGDSGQVAGERVDSCLGTLSARWTFCKTCVCT